MEDFKEIGSTKLETFWRNTKIKAKMIWDDWGGLILTVGLPLTVAGVSYAADAYQKKKLKDAKEMDTNVRLAIEYDHQCEIYDRRNGFYVKTKRPLSNYEKVLIDRERQETDKTVTQILDEHGYIDKTCGEASNANDSYEGMRIEII